jgi:methionine synthase II (cobalamin-independent)
MPSVTAKSNPPFRAEHIGSLLRPEALLQHRYAVFADKTATPESLVPVEQAAIKEIVAVQRECGFHAVTNGEFSRHQFWGTFFETLNGMEEVNLREGGYDQSIFRLYAPGKLCPSFSETRAVLITSSRCQVIHAREESPESGDRSRQEDLAYRHE